MVVLVVVVVVVVVLVVVVVVRVGFGGCGCLGGDGGGRRFACSIGVLLHRVQMCLDGLAVLRGAIRLRQLEPALACRFRG